MRVVFAGTPAFAVPALCRLLESSHEVAAVVTQPDRPSGRGLKEAASPIKVLAQQNNIPIFQPAKLKTPPFVDILRPYKPDVIVVVAYGKILPKEMLELPRYGCINIHASLLPKYRGAAPINWAIMNCETETGVTIMKLDEGMDTGDILLSESIPILEDDDALSVGNMLSVLGAELLMRVLDDLEKSGELKGTPQDHTQATYAPCIVKEDCRIKWDEGFERVLCHIMGLSPVPGAFTMLGDKRINIIQAEPFFGEKEEHQTLLNLKGFQPGSVIKILRGKGPVVRAKDGLIVLLQLQPPGKRVMNGQDFVNGGYIKEGQRFE
ncbi:MAG TPA: methionyl-tRNA formyltransferase [Candidatus Sumerlaeota bacterium]|nr:MAG: Methionyl-tRNA formyltransferase [candidate division BRC1 bacterium ADurb.Bin183]HOE63389.1 methionyl-tRNA formyltransferase [Candidatus Sumerlaeota bacterium]HRR30255.1 methionyl-tRNA formyltransferase [Candidatus Sumerlaeia bacterium]HON50868.1 methionyl-tRNA formyltransferase [Candidatus Sumerlaeota bacterium]HOR65562.1 methionyl-tRNA formyltransferase [Candidatus Sumerlaeota bacterium]